MSFTRIKACIFDLDGVIVDTAKYHFSSWKRLADRLGVNFDEEMNEGLKGVSRVNSLKQILAWGNIEIDDDKQKELRILKNSWYLNYLEDMDESEILPFAKEFILHLKERNIKIGLGSASKNAVYVLKKTGLFELFDAIVDGNMVEFTKPHPEVFLKSAEMMGVRPEDSIVFEDSVRGIEAAEAGNFVSVGIGESDVLGEADMVIPNFENIQLSSFAGLFNKA